MVDCGEGAQREFQRHRLKHTRLANIFLTHLHGDHVLGLPGLVSTLSLQQAGGHLTIHTFEYGIRILQEMFDFFCRECSYDIRWNILDPRKEEIAFENKSLRVRTIPLKHSIPAVGYVFEEKAHLRHIRREMVDFHQVPVYLLNNIKAGDDYIKPDGTVVPNHVLTTDADKSLSYAHISDTAYMPGLAEKIKGVDLLFHETTYLDDLKAQAKERGHSTALQAAMVARDAGVGALLTGHYSSRYDDDEVFRQEALKLFPNVITNREGLVVPVGK